MYENTFFIHSCALIAQGRQAHDGGRRQCGAAKYAWALVSPQPMVNEHREKDVRAAVNTASNNKCVAFDGVPGRLGPNRALEVHVPVIPARQCGARAWLWVSPAQLSGCSRFKGEIERAVSPTSGGTATPHHPHHHPPACPVDCAPQERNRQRPHAHSRWAAAGSGR